MQGYKNDEKVKQLEGSRETITFVSYSIEKEIDKRQRIQKNDYNVCTSEYIQPIEFRKSTHDMNGKFYQEIQNLREKSNRNIRNDKIITKT